MTRASRPWLAFAAAVWLGTPSAAATRQPADADRLFAGASVVDVTLDAPLADLFARARRNPLASVRGTLRQGNATIDGVIVSVRGNTSKGADECSFPKLKLKLPAHADAPLFEGIASVKVGTHCGELPDEQLTHFGRMANERAPFREAFVYRLLEAVGVPSLKSRPARFTYVDGGRRVVRNGFFVEDDRDAMARLGASREIAPEQFRDAAREFSPADTAVLAFGEALVGNFDWCLKFTAGDTYRCDAHRPLWNVRAFARDDGHAMPIASDFDVAGMVTGRHVWFPTVFFAGFSETKSPVELEVVSQVQHTRSLFPRELLDATRRHFVSRKSAAYEALAGADVDNEGRQTARAYVDAFYSAIETDAAFYRPVVVRDGTAMYLDAAATRPACGRNNLAPAGTIVSAPLARDGHMVRVALVDTLWRWAPPNKCDAVHAGPVWMDAAAIGADYPAR